MEEETSNVEPLTQPSLQCRICGDMALHANYGSVTCFACKMFFKRNAPIRGNRFRCDRNNDCEVNIHNRHICPACRLTKCFANGMRIDLIRCPLSRPIRSRHRPESIHQFPTTNALTFDASQWNRIATLTDSYDDTTVLSTAQHIRQEIERASATDPSVLVQSFFEQIYEASGRFLRANPDLRRLSSDGHSIYLRNAAENVTCLGTVFAWSQARLDQCQTFANLVVEICGSTSMDIVRHVLKFIDSDVLISKLTLSLFTFSPSFSHLLPHSSSQRLDTLALFRLEHSYTDLTWSYLLHKYGLEESVRRWNIVIQCLLAATQTVAQCQSIDKHVSDIETLVEEMELTLVLDQVEDTNED